MARPQPAKSGVLQTRRPDTHPLAPVTNDAPADAPASPAATGVEASTRIAAKTANRTDADEAAPVSGPDLRKFSIRVPDRQHRHIKVVAAQEGMSIQDLAVQAIQEYLERLGRPLPPAETTSPATP